MKKLLAILRFIWYHPLASKNRLLAFKKFFSWQISQKINKRLVTIPLVEDSVMLVKKGMTGATGNIYTGLLEFEDMAFVLHLLRKEDLFADIGANVGIYTLLAAKNAGAKVVSIEPIPTTYDILKRNVILNNISNLVEVLPCGVGDKKSFLKFTNTLDTVNHVVSNDENIIDKNIIEIPIETLDNLFIINKPSFLKIDVEGFELPVLRGADTILFSSNLKGLIIELNGSGNRYGYSDKIIHDLILSYGFKPYKYNPFKRNLTLIESYGKFNTIYVKDIDWANIRIKASKSYTILNQKV